MISKSCPEHSLNSSETLVAISGSGNVAQYAALKVIELGAIVLTLSDSKGTLLSSSKSGFSKADVEKIAALKLKAGSLSSIAEEGEWTYHEGKRPWTLVEKIHIALPCATQNEVSGEEAEALVKAGARIVAEGSNMVSNRFFCSPIYFVPDLNSLLAQGCTQEAIEVFETSRAKGGASVWYAPGSKPFQPFKFPH